MQETRQQVQRKCWCGDTQLTSFSPEYRLCSACGTLVSQAGLADEAYHVHDDQSDFYGKGYWLDHMAAELGLPRIHERHRLDLHDRCVYWLSHLLDCCLPPGKVLELGAAHGAFVAMMRWAGFDPTGLELSPWVADQARAMFQAPMIVGPLEDQHLPETSFDVVVAHDVVEHLPAPLTTLAAAVKLLKPHGVLVLQMPEFVEGKGHDDNSTIKDRFAEHMMKPREHLYLYSRRAARLLLSRFGLDHVEFRRPLFDYDMYIVASRRPLVRNEPSEIAARLETSPASRLVLALLDRFQESQRLMQQWREADADRAQRLQAMNSLGGRLRESEADREARLLSIQQLTKDLIASDEDRNARWRVIQVQKQVIEDQQAIIRSLQSTVGLLATICVETRHQVGWKKLPKSLARLLVPFALRRRVRDYIAGGRSAKALAAKNGDECNKGLGTVFAGQANPNSDVLDSAASAWMKQ